jgi:hypothetical protein
MGQNGSRKQNHHEHASDRHFTASQGNGIIKVLKSLVNIIFLCFLLSTSDNNNKIRSQLKKTILHNHLADQKLWFLQFQTPRVDRKEITEQKWLRYITENDGRRPFALIIPFS